MSHLGIYIYIFYCYTDAINVKNLIITFERRYNKEEARSQSTLKASSWDSHILHEYAVVSLHTIII